MLNTVGRGLAALFVALLVSVGLPAGGHAQQPSVVEQKLKLPKPGLPRDLVYLSDIDPTIREDIRYATANNFTGAPLPGYYRGACILRRAAAMALKRVQADLMARKPPLSLKVFDCYRPVRAVKAMVRWSKRKTNRDLKQFYFPNIAKRDLFSSGYISARSTHSTGSTVDLSIVNVSREAILAASVSKGSKKTCINSGRDQNDPSAMDMGTAYD
ncbi:MAG: M15 family metallopeptidase, partial [Pseudomonadota bacterium]